MGIVKNRERGFSLIEIVTVMVLLGILSVTAVSRLNVNSFRDASFQQELISAIRFAQKFAIASGCDVQVDVNAAADSYTLSLRNDVNTAVPASCLTAVAAFGTPLRNPVGGNFAGNAPTGTNITDGGTFAYNRQGIPFVPGTGVPLAANEGITVGGQTITIAAGTGYAEAE